MINARKLKDLTDGEKARLVRCIKSGLHLKVMAERFRIGLDALRVLAGKHRKAVQGRRKHIGAITITKDNENATEI